MRKIFTLLRLLPSINPGKSLLFAFFILIESALPVGTAVLTGLLIGSIPEAVNAGLGSPEGRETLTLLAGAAGSILLLRVVNPLQEALSTSLGREVDRYLQERVMVAVGRPAGIAHLEDPQLLDRLRLVRELGIDKNRPSLAVYGLSLTLPDWIRALASAAILLWLRWWLGLIWLVAWPLLVYYMQREYFKVAQVGYGQSSVLRRGEYLRDLALNAPAAKEIRIWGMLDWLIERFESTWRTAIEPVWKRRRPSALVIFGTSGAVVLVDALSYGLLAWGAVRGDLSLAALAVFIQAVQRANAFSAFNDSNAYLSFAAVSVPRVLELDEMLQGEVRGPSREPPPQTPQAEIRFEAVRFRYPGAEREALRGLELAIPAGRSLAIVGENGAGKTSLVKLLCGLYQPTDGVIRVDGMRLDELDPAAWRKRVAVLFQDFTHYQLPARENIAFGAPELAGDFDRLRSAAKKAGALELIENLPHGWETILSPEYKHGVDLSGGQWQKIALARALFAVEAERGVLILDEPTAALDVRAEAELYERFLEITEGLTTILISHRFSTVRRADRIIVLSDGQVIEDGSHQELLALRGRYARMFRLQARRFTEEEEGPLPLDAEASHA